MEKQLNVEELARITKETFETLKELNPIVDDLYGKHAFFNKMINDEWYGELTKLDWGSVEYIKELKVLVERYYWCVDFLFDKVDTQGAIDKYKCCNSGVLMKEIDKRRVLRHAYWVFMLNNLSEELRFIIVSSN
jgi:hypothetical protein